MCFESRLEEHCKSSLTAVASLVHDTGFAHLLPLHQLHALQAE